MNPDEAAVFLAELARFLETAPPCVDQALADHFGEDTAVDWAITGPETAAGHLTAPADDNAPPHHKGRT